MENYKYQYIDPMTQGYKKIKVSRKKHNQVLVHNKRSFIKDAIMKYEYFSKDNEVIIDYLPTFLSKILGIVLFPAFLILGGVMNYKELIDDTKRTISPRKYGSFVRHDVSGHLARELVK